MLILQLSKNQVCNALLFIVYSVKNPWLCLYKMISFLKKKTNFGDKWASFNVPQYWSIRLWLLLGSFHGIQSAIIQLILFKCRLLTWSNHVRRWSSNKCPDILAYRNSDYLAFGRWHQPKPAPLPHPKRQRADRHNHFGKLNGKSKQSSWIQSCSEPKGREAAEILLPSMPPCS